MFDEQRRPQEKGAGEANPLDVVESATGKLQELLFRLPDAKESEAKEPKKDHWIKAHTGDPDWPIFKQRLETVREWRAQALKEFPYVDSDQNGFLNKAELQAANAPWASYILSRYDQIRSYSKDIDCKIVGFGIRTHVEKTDVGHLGVSSTDLVLHPFLSLYPDNDDAKSKSKLEEIGNDSNIDVIRKSYEDARTAPYKGLSTLKSLNSQLLEGLPPRD